MRSDLSEPFKESCLDRMILFGEDPLRKAIRQFLLHYHGERNHQGNCLLFRIKPTTGIAEPSGVANVGRDAELLLSAGSLTTGWFLGVNGRRNGAFQ